MTVLVRRCRRHYRRIGGDRRLRRDGGRHAENTAFRHRRTALMEIIDIFEWCRHWPWNLGRLRSSCEIIFITLDWRLYSKKLRYRTKVILQDPVHSARLRPWPIKKFGIWQKLSVSLSCELDSSLNILSSHFELVKERSSGTERQQRPKFLIVLSLNLAKWALNSDIQVILWEKDNLARLS